VDAVLLAANDANQPFIDALAGHVGRLHTNPRRWTPALGRWLRPADIVHWNLREPFAFFGGALVLQTGRRACVATDHVPQTRNGRHYELTRLAANRRIDALVVVGPAALAGAREHWSRLPSVRVVPNGIDLAVPPRRARPAGQAGRLLFVGRLEDQKDPLFVVDVAAALRRRGVDARVHMAGDGSLAAALARRVIDLGVQDMVQLGGAVPRPDALLAETDVLITPARFEGAPFLPLEALAAGVAVVASDIPPHRDLPGPGVTVVPSRDAADWAEAVESFLATPPPDDAVRASVAPYSADTMVDATLAVYAETRARRG
jgi:glycosyltransferase involved in cell wall biosynthesis